MRSLYLFLKKTILKIFVVVLVRSVVVDYNLRPCGPADREQLVQIYRDTFTALDGLAYIDETTRRFLEKVDKKRVLVADGEGRILGFAGYDLVSDFPNTLTGGESINNLLNQELEYARSPESRTSLLRGLEARRSELGKGAVVAEFFANEFTTETFPVYPDDVYAMGLAVLTYLQGNGVGKALIKEREKVAAGLGASALYVDCWCGGRSPQMHLDLGYQPILKTGPEYEDGSASLLFGKLLK